MKLSTLLIILFVILIYSSSCKKFLDIGKPRTSVSTEAMFVDSAGASSAILAMYTKIMGVSINPNFGSGMTTLAAGQSADEIISFSTNTDFVALAQNTLNRDNSTTNAMWNDAYSLIYQANICLEGLEASQTMPERVKRSFSAEAKFVRAYAFFYLINLYGDVPYVTTTNFNVSFGMGRTPVATIYGELTKDLLYAQDNLPATYPTTATGTALGRIRPINMAATALLARVYLYKKEWANAVAASSKVIASPLYPALVPLPGSFLKDNTEAIWQLQPVNTTYNTLEGYQLITAGAAPSYYMQDPILGAFEKDAQGTIIDQRYTNWVKSLVSGGKTYYYPYKYKVRLGSVITENYTMLRLAEQFLIRAEANTELNNIPAAVDDLNIIRTRAGLPNLSRNLSQTACYTAVMQERRIELFSEWGHRWLDLKRTGKADAVLSLVKPKWVSTAVLYPIPAGELSKDPSLTQNPGYD